MARLPAAQSMNLLKRSEDISDATWLKSNLTTSTATRINIPNDLGTPRVHACYQLFRANPADGIVGQFSAQLSTKAGTLSWLFVAVLNVGGATAYLNTATGAVGTTAGNITVTFLGSDPIYPGYLRWNLTGKAVGAYYFAFYSANANGGVTYADDGTGYIDVTAFHLTTANRPGPYVATGASAVLGPIRNIAEPVVPVNKLVDGDMSAVDCAAWSAGSSALLSKVVSTRPSAKVGEQALRVTRNGVNFPYAYQNVVTSGKFYLVRTWARSATTYPITQLGNGTTDAWFGGVTTDWQQVEKVMHPAPGALSTVVALLTGGVGTWTEFGPTEVIELQTTPTRVKLGASVNKLVDGDMSAIGTAAWTVGNSAALSKVASTRPGASVGEQALHIERNGVNYPYMIQNVCVAGHSYLARGWAIPSANGYPYIASGSGTTFWTGIAAPVWQQYQFTFTASAVGFQMLSSTATGSNYVEFSPVELIDLGPTPARQQSVRPAVPLASGPMYRKRPDGLVGLWNELGHAGDFSQWDDQSGRGNHLFQATAGNRFSAGALVNGRATMESPDGKYMYATNRLDLAPVSGTTLFIVATINATNVLVNMLGGRGTTSPTGYYVARNATGATSGWVASPGNSGLADSVAIPNAERHIWGVTFNGTRAALFLDQAPALLNAWNQPGNIWYDLGAAHTTDFVVGNNSSLVAGRFACATFYEVREYAGVRHTLAEIQAICAELRAKWSTV